MDLVGPEDHVGFLRVLVGGAGQTVPMHEDTEACVRAVQAKDARFDGWFYTAVVTTGIYCRPSCPVVPPKPENMRFHPSAAAAQLAGFRACKRCRPDATPGSPQWCTRADVTARAMRLIADGVVDRDGVDGLARRLGYSTRQVERLVTAELGAGPLALARAQRAQTARVLIESTTLPMTEVAYAAGFASLRSFNATVREVFAQTPTELRQRRRGRRDGHTAGAGESAWHHVALRLPFRRPLLPDSLFGHLVETRVPGVEEWRDGAYRRTVRLSHGPGIVALSRPETTSRHVSGWPTCATSAARWPGAGPSSTSTPTRSPSTSTWPSTRGWHPSSPWHAGGVCPAPSTRRSSRCGWSWASRCPRRQPGRWPRGSWWRTAARSMTPRAA